MDYFDESQRRDEQARQREEVRRLELERDQKADQIRQLEERIASREQSLREKDEVLGEKDHHLRTKEELLGDNMAMLAAVRRALKPTAAEAPFPTDGIAVNRIELLETLIATINEAAGFVKNRCREVLRPENDASCSPSECSMSRSVFESRRDPLQLPSGARPCRPMLEAMPVRKSGMQRANRWANIAVLVLAVASVIVWLLMHR